MDWNSQLIDALAAQALCGYAQGQSPATEPSALAALALAAAGREDAARPVADWLCELQTGDGNVGIRAGEPNPGWPTSLAVLVWRALSSSSPRFLGHIEKAVVWICREHGEVARPPQSLIGHDTTLQAWAWVEGTHSWVEPTALHVLALKAAGRGTHARTRDGVRLLLDRQLPAGGYNYGNTSVLSQTLRPHVQPTGLALLALAGEPDAATRSASSAAYLASQLAPTLATASLAWAISGLAAQGRFPESAERHLEAAFRRVQRGDQSPHKLALIALAAQGARSPLVTLPAGTRGPA